MSPNRDDDTHAAEEETPPPLRTRNYRENVRGIALSDDAPSPTR